LDALCGLTVVDAYDCIEDLLSVGDRTLSSYQAQREIGESALPTGELRLGFRGSEANLTIDNCLPTADDGYHLFRYFRSADAMGSVVASIQGRA
jgi:hypothetical protein